ncbi:membrane protein [Cronobacter phage vB_CsaM_GAP32]|uniref:Putative membrane protein n=1 Tax=Cronobacter phage vB_CsaM_GAP32 TaxID=1141136 RepID=K4F6J0_9CAUD|nr:membrane protein [Cronobacter phage vB_CsaM_GAP32]AFC21876.1 putative membrane protein [Cronobacter phage vB_CsaM_GAP32]
MKTIFAVLFFVAAVVSVVFGQIPFAIFAAMFFVILLMAHKSKDTKTSEELLVEDSGMILVEYAFCSNEDEKFTAEIPHKSTESLTEEKVLSELVEYIIERTGIPTDSTRLKVLWYREVHA